MLLSGERKPSPVLSLKLAKYFELKEVEQIQFISMINQETISNPEDSAILRRIKSPKQHFDLDQMDEWYFLALYQLISHPDFQNNERWINSNLKSPITAKQIECAFEVMINKGLIHKDQRGNMLPKKSIINTSEDIIDPKIQNYHIKMLNKAKESIKKTAINLRENRNGVISIDPKLIAQAKKELKELHLNFCNKYHDDNGEAVYSCLVDFFPV